MPSEHKSTVKEKAVEEVKLMWVMFLYLAFVFSAFLEYRRLVLAEVGSFDYIKHGFALIEALIIAKVILIGQALGIGKRFEKKGDPLIIPVLVNAVLYSILVGLFTVLEHMIEGLIHKESWATIVEKMASLGPQEFMARTLITFVSFVPFFAVWEVAKEYGGDLYELFFKRRKPAERPAGAQ